MAEKTFRGDALKVAQVQLFTIGGTLEVGDILTITIGAKTYTYTAATTVLGTEAAALVALLNALSLATYPEFTGLTWAYTSGGSFTFTGTPGVKYVCTVATTEAGGGAADAQTFITSVTTAATGPEFLDNAANWGGTAPVATDNLRFIYPGKNVRYNLDAYAAVAFGSIQHTAGEIGLPAVRLATGVVEYLPRHLEVAGATGGITIGEAGAATAGGGFGAAQAGVTKSMWDTKAGTVTVNVLSTGQSSEAGVPTVLVKGTGLTVNAVRGKVGVAYYSSEVATVVLNQTFAKNKNTDSDVELGAGCTCANVVKSGGRLVVNCPVTTKLLHRGGETIIAAGAQANIDASDGGTVVVRGTGTLTAGTIANGTHLDYSQDPRAKTITNCTFRKGFKFSDPNKICTFTNPLVFQCNPTLDGELDLGTNCNLQRS